MRLCVAILLLSIPGVASPQAAPGFSGWWKQDNARCQPVRRGDVTLHIAEPQAALVVETSIAHGSQTPRHAVQKYTTDGKVSTSTGADGDTFLTAVVGKRSSLVFSIEEHEGGRVLRSTEIWSLLDHGATLQRIRERSNGDRQLILYRRMQPTPPAQDHP